MLFEDIFVKIYTVLIVLRKKVLSKQTETSSVSITSPFHIGGLKCPNRLIQGPLAGVSAAPFRRLFYPIAPPAYLVTEMISAQDVLTRHTPDSRYLYRAPEEERLAYQLAGSESKIMAQAAVKLEQIGADLIDINCGCPKSKIRKKGAGSALMDTPSLLLDIVQHVRDSISIPLTVKLRIYGTEADEVLAQKLASLGVNALIIHGRRWTDDYDVACDYSQIAAIKKAISIPVIANGDIWDETSLQRAVRESGADAYMISRAGCGRPWLYQHLLKKMPARLDFQDCLTSFLAHFDHLCSLESEHRAVIQSRTLVRYYFRQLLSRAQLQLFYTLKSRSEILCFMSQISI